VIAWLLVMGCGASDGKRVVDTAQAANTTYANDTGGFCATSPVVTYDNFGQGFLTETCNTCHASDAPFRGTADPSLVPPASATFDTESEALAAGEAILFRATGEGATMPPRGGVSEIDMERLIIWLTCAEAP
jgi:uncharacterized membrane protein